MYICHAHLCPSVYVSVCLFVRRRMPTLLHGPRCNLGMIGVPLVVHYWADLQSVHGFRCYDNIAPNAKCQRVLVYLLYAWFIALNGFPRYTLDTRSRNRRQKPAPENWRRFLERLSYNLVPNFSGARFWSRLEVATPIAPPPFRPRLPCSYLAKSRPQRGYWLPIL